MAEASAEVEASIAEIIEQLQRLSATATEAGDEAELSRAQTIQSAQEAKRRAEELLQSLEDVKTRLQGLELTTSLNLSKATQILDACQTRTQRSESQEPDKKDSAEASTLDQKEKKKEEEEGEQGIRSALEAAEASLRAVALSLKEQPQADESPSETRALSKPDSPENSENAEQTESAQSKDSSVSNGSVRDEDEASGGSKTEDSSTPLEEEETIYSGYTSIAVWDKHSWGFSELGSGRMGILKRKGSSAIRLIVWLESDESIVAHHYLSPSTQLNFYGDLAWLWEVADFAKGHYLTTTFVARFQSSQASREFHAAFCKAVQILQPQGSQQISTDPATAKAASIGSGEKSEPDGISAPVTEEAEAKARPESQEQDNFEPIAGVGINVADETVDLWEDKTKTQVPRTKRKSDSDSFSSKPYQSPETISGAKRHVGNNNQAAMDPSVRDNFVAGPAAWPQPQVDWCEWCGLRVPVGVSLCASCDMVQAASAVDATRPPLLEQLSLADRERLVQTQLAIYLHAEKCADAACERLHCAEMKKIWPLLGGYTLRQVTEHWSDCAFSNCILCTPVRQAMQEMFLGGGEREEEAMIYESASDGDNPNREFLPDLESIFYILPGPLSVSKPQRWKRLLTAERRQWTAAKLVKALLATAEPQNALDPRVRRLIGRGLRAERELLEEAMDREDYDRLVEQRLILFQTEAAEETACLLQNQATTPSNAQPICSSCSKPLQSDQDVCQTCADDLTRHFNEMQTAEAEKKESDEKVLEMCSACSKPLQPGVHVCQSCSDEVDPNEHKSGCEEVVAEECEKCAECSGVAKSGRRLCEDCEVVAQIEATFVSVPPPQSTQGEGEKEAGGDGKEEEEEAKKKDSQCDGCSAPLDSAAVLPHLCAICQTAKNISASLAIQKLPQTHGDAEKSSSSSSSSDESEWSLLETKDDSGKESGAGSDWSVLDDDDNIGSPKNASSTN